MQEAQGPRLIIEPLKNAEDEEDKDEDEEEEKGNNDKIKAEVKLEV